MLWGKGLPPLPRLDGGNDLHRSEEVPLQERDRRKTEALSLKGDGGGGPAADASAMVPRLGGRPHMRPGRYPGTGPEASPVGPLPTPSYRPATREGR